MHEILPIPFMFGENVPSLQSMAITSLYIRLRLAALPCLKFLLLCTNTLELVAENLAGLTDRLQSCVLKWHTCCSSVKRLARLKAAIKGGERERYPQVARQRLILNSAGLFALEGTCLGSVTCVHCMVQQGLLPRDAWKPWGDAHNSKLTYHEWLDTTPACRDVRLQKAQSYMVDPPYGAGHT